MCSERGLDSLFIRGNHDNIIGEALHALAQIALWPDGSKAAVDANVLDYIGELLESSSTWVRFMTCRLVGNLALHEFSAPAVLTLNPCARIVSLLRQVSFFFFFGH
jgi:hypothetical protein